MRPIILFFSSILLLAGCQQQGYDRQSLIALGTVCTIQLPAGTRPQVYDQVQKALDTVDGELSRTKASSQIAILNREKQAALSDDVLALLQEGIEVAEKTDGAFDPAIGALTGMWAIATDHPRVPSEEEIQSVDTDWRHIRIVGDQVTIPSNMEIDLGAIGKGYAADRIKEVLRENRVSSALVNLGGNIYAIGEKQGGNPWVIGLRDPNGSEGQAFITIQVRDLSLVTSGAYERNFTQDGVTYHHILDRKSGYPAESDLASASIIGPSSTLCDALSTSVFVLGSEKGMDLVESLAGYACVLVKKDGAILFSRDFPYPYQLRSI
ncbi:MAG: FAD:protein FMN transferase [Sphaerochaetaceae bacterium]|nr:FAD:protein FMN transferase [Spirochaetales bacterium]MDY5499326.1 FAD:protein FMN transferase [Sphaerochaetaceae bacterium]